MSFAYPSELGRSESSTIKAPVELKWTDGGCYRISVYRLRAYLDFLMRSHCSERTESQLCPKQAAVMRRGFYVTLGRLIKYIYLYLIIFLKQDFYLVGMSIP